MDSDLFLVIGVVFAVLSVPAMLSAFTDGRVPRLAALTVLIAAVCIVVALMNKPGGYAIEDIPAAFREVLARYG